MCDLVIHESFFLRDDLNPEERLQVDLGPYLADGVLQLCELSNDSETEMFVDLAVALDDGEAKSLAIALSRGLAVVTDDRKARRIFVEMGGQPANLLSTADVIRTWAGEANISKETLKIALNRVQIRSRFIPRSTDPNHYWWESSADSA